MLKCSVNPPTHKVTHKYKVYKITFYRNGNKKKEGRQFSAVCEVSGFLSEQWHPSRYLWVWAEL